MGANGLKNGVESEFTLVVLQYTDKEFIDGQVGHLLVGGNLRIKGGQGIVTNHVMIIRENVHPFDGIEAGTRVSFKGTPYTYGNGHGQSLRNIHDVRVIGQADVNVMIRLFHNRDMDKSRKGKIPSGKCQNPRCSKRIANGNVFSGMTRARKIVYFHSEKCRDAFVQRIYGKATQ